MTSTQLMAATPPPAGFRRAAPQTSGTHFAVATADHRCRAACYRTSRHRGIDYISTLCDAGHSVSMEPVSGPRGRWFAGSAFAASLNYLPVFAPLIATDDPSTVLRSR